jgi:hypothetical protein
MVCKGWIPCAVPVCISYPDETVHSSIWKQGTERRETGAAGIVQNESCHNISIRYKEGVLPKASYIIC